jgi:hypothetical protein
MYQKSIVAFLHLKGLSVSTKDVHIELVQVLESNATAYSTLTEYVRKDVILQNEPEAEDRAENKIS